MEKTENVIEIVRDRNYEMTSTNETQNTTIKNFNQKFLIKKIICRGRKDMGWDGILISLPSH